MTNHLNDKEKEIFEEILLCARYGELDELKQSLQSLLPQPNDSDNNTTTTNNANNELTVIAAANYFKYKDESGNTVLHMASANGHIGIF